MAAKIRFLLCYVLNAVGKGGQEAEGGCPHRKEDASAVALRDLLLFFAFNLTWPGRVEVGWHETSQSN